MGVSGLHEIIRPILKRRPIINYKGKRIGIDGHAWLYMIAHVFAEDIYNNVPITKHSKLFLRKIKTLTKFDITPIVVFDGDSHISKEITNAERAEKKKEIRKKIDKALKIGAHSRAKMLMKQCISISKELLVPVLDALKLENIEYMISPYETDAQLCFLEKIKYIDCIITEDSDLTVFGAKKVLYKFDGSYVQEYSKKNLEKCRGKFFAKNVLEISVLSGCDYLKSIRGIGLIRAEKLLEKYKTPKAVVDFLSSSKEIPTDYYRFFERALLTFKYHIVYDPISKKRTHLNPVDAKLNLNLDFLGELNHHLPEHFSNGELLLKNKNIPLTSKSILKNINQQNGDEESMDSLSFVSLGQKDDLMTRSTLTSSDLLSGISLNSDDSHQGIPHELHKKSVGDFIKQNLPLDPGNCIVAERITIKTCVNSKKTKKKQIIVDEDENCPLFDEK